MPHSDIRGSKLVRSSPRLFAAYHVLHRLRVPRHPPNALKALDRSHYPCPPRPGTRRSERWTKRHSRPDRQNDRARPRRRHGGADPRIRRREPTTDPERPVSHEIRPPPRRGVRTHLLFTMSHIRRPTKASAAKLSAHDGAVSRTRMSRAQPDRSGGAGPLVEPDGIEPTTSCLQSRRSPN